MKLISNLSYNFIFSTVNNHQVCDQLEKAGGRYKTNPKITTPLVSTLVSTAPLVSTADVINTKAVNVCLLNFYQSNFWTTRCMIYLL